MRLYEVRNGLWEKVGKDWKVAVGAAGILPKEIKVEGDGATPDGIYPIERAFGYQKRTKTNLPYRKLSKKDIWVDDPNSKYYNQYLPGKLGKIEGKSVYNNPEVYRLFVVIEYNTKNIESGKGSMLFVHSWSDLTKSTYGCVGMKQKELEVLINWLDSQKNPVLILLAEPFSD